MQSKLNKTNLFFKIAIAIAFALFLNHYPLFAEGDDDKTGRIIGYVKDATTQEPLLGVVVTVDGTQLGSVTNEVGRYTITNIPVGTYNIKATYLGYESLIKYNVPVITGAPATVNFDLQQADSKLEEVVVQASPFRTTSETPNSIQSLSRTEIASYPGGNNDIAKVVQSLPGVSGSVGFRNDIIIRGGAPNENVYYLDDVEIPNINHFSTQGSAGGPVGMLNVSFIDEVTLSSGAFPAQYDNVLSGVLQFRQRRGDEENHHFNVRLSASELAVTTEGPITKNTTYIASVRRSYLQLLFKLIDLPFLPDYWDYQYKISHRLGKNDEISFIGLGSIDNLTVNRPADLTLDQAAIIDQLPFIRQWTTTHGVSWRHLIDKGYTTLTGSTNILNNEFSRYRDVVTKSGLRLKNQSQEAEFRLRYSLNKQLGDYNFGAGALAILTDYKNTTFNQFDENSPADQYNSEIVFLRYGLFSTLQRTYLNGRLNTSAGLRIDGNTFTTNGNDIYRTLAPRLSAQYALNPKWAISATAGRFSKIAPYTILGYRDTSGTLVNRNEDYIINTQLTTGIEFLPRQSSRITVDGFLKLYENYPVSIRDGVSLANLGGDFSVLGNEPVASVGKGRTYGVEVTFQQKLNKNFYGIFAYTLYWSEFSGLADPNKYIASSWDNRHLITFTGGYKLPRNWEIGVRVRWLGPQPYSPVDSAATVNNYFTRGIVPDYTRANTKRLDPFFQADMRIDKKWNFDNWSFQLFIDIQNILNQNLPSQPDYTLERDASNISQIAEPRNLVVIPEIRSNSVLPTIGVVIDF